jgi:hypothetical protein
MEQLAASRISRYPLAFGSVLGYNIFWPLRGARPFAQGDKRIPETGYPWPNHGNISETRVSLSCFKENRNPGLGTVLVSRRGSTVPRPARGVGLVLFFCAPLRGFLERCLVGAPLSLEPLQ